MVISSAQVMRVDELRCLGLLRDADLVEPRDFFAVGFFLLVFFLTLISLIPGRESALQSHPRTRSFVCMPGGQVQAVVVSF